MPQILAKRLANLCHCSCTNGLRQHICFPIKGKQTFVVWTYLQMHPISIQSWICKNYRCSILCIPKPSWRCCQLRLQTVQRWINQHDVDHLRMDIFSHKMRGVDRLPPTSDALHCLHLKRSVFQASIWVTANEAMRPHHNPTDYGWKEDNGRLIPVWTTLSEAKEVFYLDILCFCKQPCSSVRANARRQTRNAASFANLM